MLSSPEIGGAAYHPKFGLGVVTRLDDPPEVSTLTVVFPTGVTRRILPAWLYDGEAEFLDEKLRSEASSIADDDEVSEPGHQRHGRRSGSSDARGKSPGQTGDHELQVHWHGDAPPAPRAWLAVDLLPEAGVGLLAGQWGTGKTFAALDLAASAMTGATFAGRDMLRRGGVLFVAAEGASEIRPRLQAIVEHKLTSSGSVLPFAWVEGCPSLLDDPGALSWLTITAEDVAARLEEQHQLPLVLIVVDTIAASAGFTNENDTGEAQRVMNLLRDLSEESGALVIGIDHFGKLVDTGVRGSSAKEAAADVILALLADRDLSGSISNTRMSVRKLRGGRSGFEIPFDLRVVSLASDNPLRIDTSCVIDWRDALPTPPSSTAAKDRWSGSLRVFRASMTETLLQHGEKRRPFGVDGPEFKAVSQAKVKAEFFLAYPIDGEDDAKRQDAKRSAFTRAVKSAVEKGLIGAREIGGVDYLWFAGD